MLACLRHRISGHLCYFVGGCSGTPLGDRKKATEQKIEIAVKIVILIRAIES